MICFTDPNVLASWEKCCCITICDDLSIGFSDVDLISYHIMICGSVTELPIDL